MAGLSTNLLKLMNNSYILNKGNQDRDGAYSLVSDLNYNHVHLALLRTRHMPNYRPISVISVIAKVFERIIYNQLSSYLSENNILSQYQSGFRSFHSTMTALLEATDDWAFNIDRGYVNAVVFLDLKKSI